MKEKIMQDNILYLKEWMRYNPSLQNNLVIEGNHLILQMDGKKETQDISGFYLPEMLYNDTFRENIPLEKEIDAAELFKIIRLYIETNEIVQKQQEKYLKYPKIEEVHILKDDKNIEFVLIVDEHGQKYRYDTSNPEKVVNMYNDLKEKNAFVTIKELGSVIKNDNTL